MLRSLKWSVALATAFGVAVTLWAIGRAGFGDTVAVVGRMGLGGFALFTTSTLVVFLALGAAWASAARRGDAPPLLLFMWARAVREAANDLLPFSQIGGLVLGMRTLGAAGIAPARIYAATIVDLTTEMMSQFVLTVVGLAIFGGLLAAPKGGDRLQLLAWAGVAAMALLTGALMLLQRPALALAASVGGRMLPGFRDSIDAVRDELAAFGRSPRALLAPFLWNLAAWLLSVAAAWLGLYLLGARLAAAQVVALEALIFALRSSAFLVPGGLGVQEAGYILLAPMFGLDRDTALALSLVKRARDVCLGLPTLLIYQAREGWAGRRRR